MRPRGKRVRVNPNNPRGWAICDRCGQLGNLADLVQEMEWRSNRLMWTGFLVHPAHLDKPQEQLRPRILEADPVPLKNVRPENFHREDNEIILASANIGLGTETQIGLQVDAAQPLAVFLADNPARQYNTLGLVIGAIAGYSLRQINLGFRGSAVRVYRPLDGQSTDIGFLNYGFNVPAAKYFAGNGTLLITRFYDQSGWRNDAVQLNPALMPQLVLNSPVGPGVLFSGGQEMIAPQTFQQTQPFTYGAVATPMGGGLPTQALLASTGAMPLLGFLPGAATLTDTSNLTISSTFGEPHSLMGVFNTGSSTLSQDGVTVTGNPGSDAVAGTIALGSSGGSNFFIGLLSEAYVWGVAKGAQDIATVNKIAHAVYGF